MELKKYKLGDIAEIIGGVAFQPSDICENGIRILRGGNIQSQKIELKDNDVFLPQEYENSENQVRFGDTILVASTGSVEVLGKAATCFVDMPNTQIGAFLRIIRPKDIKYAMLISIALNSDYFAKYIKAQAKGTSINNITVGYLKDFVIYCPDNYLPICDFYLSLEKKLALNRQINQNLEEMAKQLYDYWFVQFDFPNEEGKPYKSSGGKMVYNPKLKRQIPDGWEVDKVSSLINPIERGISYSSDDLLDNTATPMINLACFSKSGDYRTGEMKFYSGNIPENKSIEPMDMLIACTDMTQNADIIGRPIFASHEFKKYTFSTDLAKLQTKSNMKMYLYYTLRTSFYHKYIRPFASGTNVKHLNLSGVENYVISIPPETIQLNFEKIILPIKNKQSKILNEIASLTKQRDELLPLLMNGQVSVVE